MNITQIDHFVITTKDLTRCLHFYVDILNLVVEHDKGRYALRFGNQKINIHRKKAEFLPAAAHATFGSQDFCLIASGDINQIKAELAAKDCIFEGGIVERNGAGGVLDSLYLRDPDGNLVEIGVYRQP